MKIKYSRPKGLRYKKQFFWLECRNRKYRFDEERKIWDLRDNMDGYGRMHQPCHSLKSALRILKHQSNIPKGITFKLVSHWVGYDIHITI